VTASATLAASASSPLLFFDDDSDFRLSPLIKVSARFEPVVDLELTVEGVVCTVASFFDFFVGFEKVAFDDGFVGVSRTAAAFDVFFWTDFFEPVAMLLLFGFDLSLAATFAGTPACFFLSDLTMTKRVFWC